MATMVATSRTRGLPDWYQINLPRSSGFHSKLYHLIDCHSNKCAMDMQMRGYCACTGSSFSLLCFCWLAYSCSWWARLQLQGCAAATHLCQGYPCCAAPASGPRLPASRCCCTLDSGTSLTTGSCCPPKLRRLLSALPAAALKQCLRVELVSQFEQFLCFNVSAVVGNSVSIYHLSSAPVSL